MQKGKDMHRRRGELIVTRRSVALICVVWLAAAADSNASEHSARLPAGCPRGGVASGNVFFGIGAGAPKRAGFHAAVANPYMLDGLSSSELLLGVDGRSFSVWLDWRHLGHTLYREDRLAAAIGFPFPCVAGIRLRAMPAIERRAARGFAAEGSSSVSLGISYDRGGNVRIGYVRLAAASEENEPRDARVFLFARASFLVLAVDRAISGVRGRDAQCALEAWLSDAWALAAGYRWQTGEISSGCIVRISRTILDFSWNRNPALGSTVTAGAGRLWEW